MSFQSQLTFAWRYLRFEFFFFFMGRFESFICEIIKNKFIFWLFWLFCVVFSLHLHVISFFFFFFF